MTIFSIPAVLIGLGAVIFVLQILAVLSRKLGAVTKMKPYYRRLYVSIGLMTVALLVKWLIFMVRPVPDAAPTWLLSEWFYFVGFVVPVLGGAGLAVVVVLRYWSWLFRESDR